MFYPIPNGSIYEVPDNAFGFIYKCQLPPVGYGVNSITNELQETDIICRSEIPEEQYWERYTLPKDWKDKRIAEKERQKFDRYYIDPYLEAIRTREWKRRLCGVWFWNFNSKTQKSELLYITGTHYFYTTYWKFQGRFMDFRINDMEAWYVVKYCETDPDCLGLNEITKRKLGKTAKLGCWIYERTSRPPTNQHAGFQSKTDDDAEEVMMKAIVQPWQKLPDFFRPIYDTMKGDSPNELRFFHTSRRGSSTDNEREEEDALESWIDFGASGVSVYDGPELDTYGSDEAGKCFGEGTKIRMYDGSIKNVEEIENGEQVMGDDSTPRNVYGVTSGSEELYRIIPKKGESWVCNKSHILSLKWCLNKKNISLYCEPKSVVNISMEKYLSLKPYEKSHLMLYKNPVEYNSNNHIVDPYFMGLWLGDGTKHNVEITTNDFEVVDYLYGYAKKENLRVSKSDDIRYYLGVPNRKVKGVFDGKEIEFDTIADTNRFLGHHPDAPLSIKKIRDYGLSVSRATQQNHILKEFKRLGVKGNKHIPVEYLIDSRINRLQLLAGLVDSDGHIQVGSKNKLPKGIEITQKIKRLAEDIKELATSLGFYASINPKLAKMRRTDKSVYECVVYRVNIYGDLWEIPTKVKRKQVPKRTHHLNRRLPPDCGFHVEPIGVGDYFGFAVDGNSLFLLSDGTVVHNTKKPVSIKERQNTVRFCSEIDGEFKHRKQYYTTTVEIEEGEEDNYEFQEMTADSNPTDRNLNNRTKTGLYTYFLPAQKGMYFDKYGYPDEERAITFLLNERKKLEDDGDTRRLSSFKRKNPMSFKEAFSADGSHTLYDPELLNEQLDYISWRTDVVEKGDLKWVNDSPFVIDIVNEKGEVRTELNKVIWVDNPNGKFEKVKGWWPKDPNKVYENNGAYLPNNNFSFRVGYDTFKYDKTKDKRRSNAAAFAYQIKDDTFPSEYDDMFVLKYAHRPSSRRIANMDVLMMSWLCGCQMLVERNAGDHYREHYKEWDCNGFLMWLPGEAEPGITTDGKGNVVQMICNYTEQYINENIKKVFFKSLIRKQTGWLDFKIEDTQKFDEPMAAGFTLIAVKGKKYGRSKSSAQNVESIMPYKKAM